MKTVYEIRDVSTGKLYKAPYGCRFVYAKMRQEKKILALKLLSDILRVFPESAKVLDLFEVEYNENGEESQKWLVWGGRHNLPADIEHIILFDR